MEKLELLVAAAQKGDRAAFNQLYEYSYDTVRGECLKNLHNELDAEDVMQETYILIYRKLNGLKEPQKFLGWCRTIAHNAAVSYIVSRRRKTGLDDFKPQVSDDDYAGMDTIGGEDTELSPEEKAEQKMLHELLQNALNDIPFQRATCLAMYQQGISYREISGRLSIPVGTVKSNVFYAKQALREKIKEIEEKQHVQIHGFTLIPLADQVEVRMTDPSETGFIQAETSSSSAMKEEVWKNVSGKLFTGSSTAKLHRQILAIVLAASLFVGGITFAIQSASHKEDLTTTARARTTISQVANSTNRNASRTGRVQERQRQVIPPAGRLTATERAEEPTTAAPATTATTREVYTF